MGAIAKGDLSRHMEKSRVIVEPVSNNENIFAFFVAAVVAERLLFIL